MMTTNALGTLTLAVLASGDFISCGMRSAGRESAGLSEVSISGGNFIAGADCRPGRAEPDCDRSFHDGRREVALDGFRIDRDLAAPGSYERCVRAGRCSSDMKISASAALVRFEDALAYCLWSGGILQSGDQFERIARGTDGRGSPWGSAASPCRDSAPSEACLSYEGPEGARGLAFRPQWAKEGLIRGASEFSYEALDPESLPAAAAYAGIRCVRPERP